jgi:hypothetical protein
MSKICHLATFRKSGVKSCKKAVPKTWQRDKSGFDATFFKSGKSGKVAKIVKKIKIFLI